jgi:site-specific DNA recombinase
MLPNRLRCAIYIRVSGRQQVKGVSLEDQEHACRAFAARNGWTVVEPLYVEPGRSAFTERLDTRVAFQQLLADAQQRRFDVVLVYKLNRFARNVPAQYAAAAELERYGVQIASVTEPIERATASGRAIFGSLAVLAQLQSDQLSEKMRDTRLAEARQGRLVGPVPVGYERRDGQLVPTPQAEALRLAFQMLCTGDYGATKITRAINAAGYKMPDGSPFKVTAVQEMLTNPVYAGFVTCAGQVFPGNHEAIIDLATWERAQEIVKARSWHRPRPDSSNKPLLAGLAMCPYCGAPMWHNASSKYRYYRCSASTTQRGSPTPGLLCLNIHAQAEAVEQITLALLAVLALTPELLEQAKRLAQEAPTQPAAPSATEIQARLNRLGEAYADGVVNKAVYERKRDELLALLARSAAMPAPQAVGVETLVPLLKDLPTLLMQATNSERRAVVRELVTHVYVQRSVVMAIRPTKIAAVSNKAAAMDHRDEWLKFVRWWAGWVSYLSGGWQLTTKEVMISQCCAFDPRQTAKIQE